MSLRDLAATDAASIFATGDVETVTQWPCGVSGNAETVTGIWEPDETPNRMADMDGEQTVTTGSLHLLSSVTVDADDVWVIEDECYSTLSVGVVCGGMRTLTLQFNDRLTTSRHRGGLL